MTISNETRLEVLQKIQISFVTKMQDFKNKGAQVELLNSPSWKELEQAWLYGNFERVETLLREFEKTVKNNFESYNKIMSETVEEQSKTAEHDLISNYIPNSLLISRNSYTSKKYTMSGIAITLADYGTRGGNDGGLLRTIALKMPGSGQLQMSGFKERDDEDQVRIAHSLLRMRLKNTYDLHVEGEGRGVSGGLSIFLAMMSTCNESPISNKLAVSGVLSLTGEVLPVGGLLGKLIGAYRNGIKTVILPKENQGAVVKFPNVLLEAIDVRYVSTVDEALKIVF